MLSKYIFKNTKIFYNMICINFNVNLAIKQQINESFSEELTWLEAVISEFRLTRRSNILWSVTDFE